MRTKLECEIRVDGLLLASDDVFPSYQKDPFPGGHDYSCLLSGGVNWLLFDELPIGRTEEIGEEESRRFFLALSMVFEQFSQSSEIEPRYFLNNVSVIEFDGVKLSFSGQCSPVVSVKDGS